MTAPPQPASSTVPRPPVPLVLWAFALTFLVEELVQLVVLGPKDDGVSVVGSALLGVAVVLFFSVGVARARTVRTSVVGVLLGLVVLLGLLDLVTDPSATGLLGTAVAAVQGWLLWRYTTTTWWAWQRTRPERGRSLAPVLAVAVLVGVVGGIADGSLGPERGHVSFHVSF